MKIAFVNTHFTIYGGAGRVVMDYANVLCEMGHKIVIVAQKIETSKYNFNKKIKLVEVGAPIPRSLFHWLFFKKIKKKFVRILEELDCEIYISQNFPTNYFCSKISKRLNFKHVYFCHEPNRLLHDKNYFSHAPFLLKISGSIIRLLFKKYDIEGARNADFIISNSFFTKDKVKQYYKRNSYVNYPIPDLKENAKVLVSFDLIKELNLSQNNPILFTLGLSHHMKGVKELILIFYNVFRKIPEARLVIGGWISRENKKTIKKYIKELAIPENKIIIYGYIRDEFLSVFYLNSVITYYTAIEEPFGLIPIESMKYGTPVIAFDGYGPSETILDGKTGFLIKNYDLNNFVKKTIEIVKNKELYEKLSKKAVEHVKENFDFRNGVSRFESILYKIKNFNQ